MDEISSEKNNSVTCDVLLRTEDGRFEALRKISEFYNPVIGPWVYDTWKTLNEKYFGGSLRVGSIVWGLTEWSGSLGYFTPSQNKITLHRSLINPQSEACGTRELLCERMTEDVILHEMLHQKLFQELGYCADKFGCHNFQPWCDEINRMNPLLGLEGKATVNKQRRIKEAAQNKGSGKAKWMPSEDGTMTRTQIATWPHSLRQREYYETSCHEILNSIVKGRKE
jgi:hypothetical protein